MDRYTMSQLFSICTAQYLEYCQSLSHSHLCIAEIVRMHDDDDDAVYHPQNAAVSTAKNHFKIVVKIRSNSFIVFAFCSYIQLNCKSSSYLSKRDFGFVACKIIANSILFKVQSGKGAPTYTKTCMNKKPNHYWK